MPNPSLLQTLGLRIRAARRQRGLTQAELAEAADMAPETVSRVEGGKLETLSVAAVERVAGALGITVGSLMDGTASPPPGPRPSVRRIVTLVSGLDDRSLKAVDKGLRAFLGLRNIERNGPRRPAQRRRR